MNNHSEDKEDLYKQIKDLEIQIETLDEKLKENEERKTTNLEP